MTDDESSGRVTENLSLKNFTTTFLPGRKGNLVHPRNVNES